MGNLLFRQIVNDWGEERKGNRASWPPVSSHINISTSTLGPRSEDGGFVGGERNVEVGAADNDA